MQAQENPHRRRNDDGYQNQKFQPVNPTVRVRTFLQEYSPTSSSDPTNHSQRHLTKSAPCLTVRTPIWCPICVEKEPQWIGDFIAIGASSHCGEFVLPNVKMNQLTLASLVPLICWALF